jgi:hypothetical protein
LTQRVYMTERGPGKLKQDTKQLAYSFSNLHSSMIGSRGLNTSSEMPCIPRASCMSLWCATWFSIITGSVQETSLIMCRVENERDGDYSTFREESHHKNLIYGLLFRRYDGTSSRETDYRRAKSNTERSHPTIQPSSHPR